MHEKEKNINSKETLLTFHYYSCDKTLNKLQRSIQKEKIKQNTKFMNAWTRGEVKTDESKMHDKGKRKKIKRINPLKVHYYLS